MQLVNVVVGVCNQKADDSYIFVHTEDDLWLLQVTENRRTSTVELTNEQLSSLLSKLAQYRAEKVKE